MKKYATVPYIIKAKRFKKEIERPCIKNHAVYTVGFCSDRDEEPQHEAHLDAEFSVSLLDIFKIGAFFAAITAVICTLVHAVTRD